MLICFQLQMDVSARNGLCGFAKFPPIPWRLWQVVWLAGGSGAGSMAEALFWLSFWVSQSS